MGMDVSYDMVAADFTTLRDSTFVDYCLQKKSLGVYVSVLENNIREL